VVKVVGCSMGIEAAVSRLSGNELLYRLLQWAGWIGEVPKKVKPSMRAQTPDLPRDGRLRGRDCVH
jgi:hypothetical protein